MKVNYNRVLLVIALMSPVACVTVKTPPAGKPKPVGAPPSPPVKLTATEEELKRVPLRDDLPGDPPAKGLRY